MLVLSNLESAEGSEEGVRQQTIFGKRSSIRRSRLAIEIQRFAEDETDEDFSDILGADETFWIGRKATMALIGAP